MGIIDPTVKFDIKKEKFYLEEKFQDEESGMKGVKKHYIDIHLFAEGIYTMLKK